MNSNQPNPAISMATLWILWVALLTSHIMVSGVGHFFLFQQAGGENEAGQNFLYVFLAMAIAITVISQFFFGKAKAFLHLRANGESQAEEQIKKSMVPFILCWALGESITIYGLVLPTVGGTNMIQFSYGFFALGIGLHLYRRPN